MAVWLICRWPLSWKIGWCRPLEAAAKQSKRITSWDTILGTHTSVDSRSLKHRNTPDELGIPNEKVISRKTEMSESASAT